MLLILLDARLYLKAPGVKNVLDIVHSDTSLGMVGSPPGINKLLSQTRCCPLVGLTNEGYLCMELRVPDNQ